MCGMTCTEAVTVAEVMGMYSWETGEEVDKFLPMWNGKGYLLYNQTVNMWAVSYVEHLRTENRYFLSFDEAYQCFTSKTGGVR